MLGTNTLVNFAKVRNRAKRGVRMALAGRAGGAGATYPDLLFHPNDATIGCYNTTTGKLVRTLKAHMDVVNCCVFHPHRQELYTGSNDQQILVWAPPPRSLLDGGNDDDDARAAALRQRAAAVSNAGQLERDRASLLFAAGHDLDDQWSSSEDEE